MTTLKLPPGMTQDELLQLCAEQMLTPGEILSIHNCVGTTVEEMTTFTEDAILNLPILQCFTHKDVGLADELVTALVEEQKIRKLIAQQRARQRQRDAWQGDNNYRKTRKNKSYFVLSRQYKEKEQSAQEAATKHVAKQYRKLTVKLHPDRHGDEYQAEFDALVLAYEVMSDVETRTDYVDKLLRVMAMGTDNTELMEQAHQAYMVQYQQQKENSTEWARYQQATNQQTKFYLETHKFQQPPRALNVTKVHKGSPCVNVSLPPMGQEPATFQEMCQSVSIFVEGSTNQQPLKKLSGKALEKAFDVHQLGYISTTLTLPDYGIWQLYWKAQLRVDSNSQEFIDTPLSASREIDLEHPALTASKSKLPGLIQHAKQLTFKLQNESRKLQQSTTTTGSADEVEQKYWQLHHLIAKGRSIAKSLWKALEELGYSAPLTHEMGKELELLLTCIDTCAREKSQLDDKIQYNNKKLSMKSFKHSVAKVIEEGRLAEWILEVQPADLVNTGGEVNRLYQLLTEGNKNSLALVDSVSLLNAATRTDLFSTKQCSVLETKASEVEARMVEETERLLKEEAERNAAEQERRDLERQAALGLEIRSTVILQDLKQRTDLNGTTGIYMGISTSGRQGDRYLVRVNGIDMALRAANFREWKGGAIWTCPHCTFFNKGENAKSDVCACCSLSRNSEKPSTTTTKKTDNKTKAPPAPTTSKVKATAAAPKPAAVVAPAKKPAPAPAVVPIRKPAPAVAKPIALNPPRATPPAAVASPAPAHVQPTFNLAQMTAPAKAAAPKKPAWGGAAPAAVKKVPGGNPPATTAWSAEQHKAAMLEPPPTQQPLSTTKQPLAVRKVTMYLPEVDVSAFIGRGGSHVTKLREDSGASIVVDKTKKKGHSVTIYLEGDVNQVMFAQLAIERFLQTRKERRDGTATKPASPLQSTKPATNYAAAVESTPSAPKGPVQRYLMGLPQPAATTKQQQKPLTAKDTTIFRTGSQTPSTTTPLTVPDSISIISPPTVDEEETSAVTEPVLPDPTTAAVTPSSQAAAAPAAATMDSLLLFLCQQASCLKCKPEEFYEFLRGEDIVSLKDLQEGAGDDDFLQEMLGAGLKGFKKAPFKRAVASAAKDVVLLQNVPMVDNGLTVMTTTAGVNNSSKLSQMHLELECPICYELMVKDPVMASDGFTYERHAIQQWFERHQDSPEGIRSPKTNMIMTDLTLIPNIQMRTMAREMAARG